MMEPVLAVEGVRKAFGGIDAVIDVSLRVNAGERVALIGPNGAWASQAMMPSAAPQRTRANQ